MTRGGSPQARRSNTDAMVILRCEGACVVSNTHSTEKLLLHSINKAETESGWFEIEVTLQVVFSAMREKGFPGH